MALEEYPVSSAAPLKGGGIDDSQAVVQSPDFFRLRGVTQRDGKLIKMYGKRKTVSFGQSLGPTVVTAIHFDNKGNCFVQTDTNLYKYLETDITGSTGTANEIV